MNFFSIHWSIRGGGLTSGIFLLLMVLFFHIGSGIAQEDENVDDPCENSEETERVPVGTIASVGTYGPLTAIDVDLGEEVPGGAASVIHASIQTVKANRCKSVVRNTSECNAYSLGLRIREYESGGNKKNVVSESITINPGGKREFSFACDNRKNYRVEITSSKIVKRN